MRIGPNARYASLIAGLMLAATPGAASADAAATFYERSFVLAAHQRCGLFQRDVAAALDAAAWQARGAALRGGAGEVDLGARLARARSRAASTACANPDLATVKQRVEQGFAGWSRLARMEFPGDRAGWSADRYAFTRPGWRLSQSSLTGASPVRFGYPGMRVDAGLAAVVSFVGRPRPYAARVTMRDARLAPRAWPGGLPPAPQRRVIWSSGFTVADPGLVAPKTVGEAWAFPADMAGALMQLDPRERFTVEFLFRDDSVATAEFEAGDFAAGRAFLAMGGL